jgi:polyisoprenoid-binding protein YceI
VGALFLLLFPGFHDFIPDSVYYTESGKAEFTSRVPLHTFTGESEHLTGLVDPKNNEVDFYLDLSTIKSGIGRRDRDIYRTLDIEQYPFAEFTGTITSGIDWNSSELQRVAVSGTFTLHGISQNVEIEGSIRREGEALRVQAEWEINLHDYNIEPPGILFYRVNEIQEVRMNAYLDARPRDEILN